MQKNSIKSVLIEDDRYEVALEKGLAELGVSEAEAVVKILQEGSSGFLGFLSRPFKLKISRRDAAAEAEAPAAAKAKPADRPRIEGTWKILSHDEGLFILTSLPDGATRLPDFSLVAQDLKTLGMKQLDFDALKSAFQAQNVDSLIKIAPADPAFKFDRDAKVEVLVDRDAMGVSVAVSKAFGDGRPATREAVLDKLKQAGVRVAIDEAKLDAYLAAGRFDAPAQVAVGAPPSHGVAASVRWAIDSDSENLRISIRDDGTVDFHKSLKINNVRAGDVIGTLREATPGKDGFDVFLNALPAKPGRELKLTPGKNVELSEDGRKFISTIDGQLLVRKDVPAVLPIFEVRGNVDIGTGDIDFVGNVIVHGDIMDGFEVKADGNVEVRGMVNCSRIDATGNILIQGGFLGKDKGELTSEGSIGVKFVESGTIRAAENVIIERAVMHATIMAGRKVHVKGSKGLIVGGSVTAGEEIESTTIGSNLGTKTLVTAGIAFAKKDKLVKFDRELDEINLNLDKILKTLAFFERIVKTSGALSPEQELLRTKSLSIQNQLQGRRVEIENGKLALDSDLDVSNLGRVTVHNLIYPGTTVTIRKAVLSIKDPVKCSSLEVRDGEIRVGPIL